MKKVTLTEPEARRIIEGINYAIADCHNEGTDYCNFTVAPDLLEIQKNIAAQLGETPAGDPLPDTEAEEVKQKCL